MRLRKSPPRLEGLAGGLERSARTARGATPRVEALAHITGESIAGCTDERYDFSVVCSPLALAIAQTITYPMRYITAAPRMASKGPPPLARAAIAPSAARTSGTMLEFKETSDESSGEISR